MGTYFLEPKKLFSNSKISTFALIFCLFILFGVDNFAQIFNTPLSDGNVTYISQYIEILKKQFDITNKARYIILDKDNNSKGLNDSFDPEDRITVIDTIGTFVFYNNKLIEFSPSPGLASTQNVVGEPVLITRSEKSLRTIIGASGEIKSSIENQSNSEATGVLKIRFEKPNGDWGYQVTGSIGILATDDTISSDYGSSLLIPQSGKSSAVLDIAFYQFWDSFLGRDLPIIYRFYTYISTTTWAQNIDDRTSYSENGSIFGYGLLVGLQLFSSQDANNKNNAAITFQIGYARRSIFGDLSYNQNTLQNFLNSDSDTWGGFEVGFMTYYKGINVGLSYYYFGDDDISGFSNGQVTGGISFSIDLIEF
jgi:hypothetical protein